MSTPVSFLLNVFCCNFISLAMEVHFSLPLMRHFLRTSACPDGDALLRKACVDGEPAAVQLLVLALKIRANRRTRRSFSDVVDNMDKSSRPRWLRELVGHLFSLYNLLVLMCAPTEHNAPHSLNLSRRQQRALARTGAVRENRVTFKAASTDAQKLFQPDYRISKSFP